MNHKNSKNNELSIPEAAMADKDAMELFRAWIADGGLHVSIRADIWEDPAAYGIALVDLAKHIANACGQSDGSDYELTLRRVKEGFDAEWGDVTGHPTGGLK